MNQRPRSIQGSKAKEERGRSVRESYTYIHKELRASPSSDSSPKASQAGLKKAKAAERLKY